MTPSVNYWMVGGFEGETPIAQAAETAQSIGYGAIELCYGAGELTSETSKSGLAAIRDAIDAAGIEIASLATGYYWTASLSSPDEDERSAAVAFTEAYIRAAAALDVDTVLVLAGSIDVAWDPSRPVVPAKTAIGCSRKSIESLIPVAEEHGVRLGIENVWSKLLTGPFEYMAFIDSFASPFVKSYFDVGNCLINGYPEHWIELLGNRIVRVHFKNFNRRDGGGGLGDFTSSLLEGDVNWPAVFAALKDAGYNKYLTAEVIVGDAGMPNVDQAERVCTEMTGLIARNGMTA